MAISDSTLRQDIHSLFRTILVGNVTTTNPQTSEVKTASVSASYNDKYQARPQIVIAPLATDKTYNKFGSTGGKQFISVPIEIYASNTDYLDQMSDQVVELVDANIPLEMELVGMSEDYAFTNPDLTKYHKKTLTFTFDKE